MVEQVNCPECGGRRPDPSVTCPSCGAPPMRAEGEQRGTDEEVREQDLEPYITLRYIARLFKIFAAIMLILIVAEVVAGLTADATAALPTLIVEITKMLVAAGLLWGFGDLTLLIIDAGHDLRVVRILLGRINAELHRKEREK